MATLASMQRRERRTVGIRPIPRLVLLLLALAALTLGAAGCGRDDDEDEGSAPPADTGEATETTEALSGDIEIDGSSTVGPLTTAAAEAFRGEQPNVNVTVGISGTGGGFERFCAGETDISNASRPIDEEEEVPLCEEAGIEYTDFQVGVDALTVVVNPENDWATCLTTEQLKTIWEPKAEDKITNWNQVDPSFPDQPLALAGPGTDSGTFDYFTDEINGEEGASRSDYTASEDDNVTVQAVAGDPGALGYLGYTYYEENADSLKAVEIDGGDGCVAPSVETARDGTYVPLSRPLFIYVKNDALARPEVHGFVEYFLTNSIQLAEDALFIPVPDDQVATNLSTLESSGS
jgi:phosphate transport system substrate-binding protein